MPPREAHAYRGLSHAGGETNKDWERLLIVMNWTKLCAINGGEARGGGVGSARESFDCEKRMGLRC